jgi:2,3-bisphosphoglycerate-independent phosphoglycerate mutase
MNQAKTALIILDGFGISPEPKGNAILAAKTPNLDIIYNSFPKALLKASAEEVGLPWGEFGSSEVGHTTIGLGRIILQNLLQINHSFEDKSFEGKPVFKDIVAQVDKGSVINIIFVLSDGGVHGHIDHTIELIQLIRDQRPKCRIKLHLITDGRDTAEKSAKIYLANFKEKTDKYKNLEISSLMGRYYAMDRDKNWERIGLAYNAILGSANRVNTPEEAIEASYKENKTDEFITPYTFSNSNANLDSDVFIFTNYRADRAIQLTRAFVDQSITSVKTKGIAKNFYTMTTYDDNIDTKVLFSNIELSDSKNSSLNNPLVQVLSDNNLSQFHVAETEKFAHITYFFAGGVKQDYKGQTNRLIESKKIPSYDVFPQMRAAEISTEIIKASEQNFDFIVANFANGDMVGHSGNFEAATKAVEIMDRYLGQAIGKLLKSGYVVFICGDHGNCDEMIDFNSGKPNKEHTLNPVPFILCDINRKGSFASKDYFFNSNPIGLLADIAPSILNFYGIKKNREMSGINIMDSLN